jgi:hypothetical protein
MCFEYESSVAWTNFKLAPELDIRAASRKRTKDRLKLTSSSVLISAGEYTPVIAEQHCSYS